jgi:hypothetical protein
MAEEETVHARSLSSPREHEREGEGVIADPGAPLASRLVFEQRHHNAMYIPRGYAEAPNGSFDRIY